MKRGREREDEKRSTGKVEASGEADALVTEKKVNGDANSNSRGTPFPALDKFHHEYQRCWLHWTH